MKKTPFFIASILAAVLTFQPAMVSAVKMFSDLSESSPYFTTINELNKLGIVQGNEDGSVGAENTITRAGLTTIVIRAKNIVPLPSDQNCFPDVSEEWYAGSICAAFRLGYINGYPDGLFRPAREVTAGEAAKITVNTIQGTEFKVLEEALAFMADKQLVLQSYQSSQAIKRNEAFERLYRTMNADSKIFQQEEPAVVAASPSYIPFDQSAYDARLGTGPMVLFFHATWCSLCKASNKVLEENLDEFEGDVVWHKVDYDTETELKSQYGVTFQDTFVAINANGQVVKVQNAVRNSDGIQDLMDAALGQ